MSAKRANIGRYSQMFRNRQFNKKPVFMRVCGHFEARRTTRHDPNDVAPKRKAAGSIPVRGAKSAITADGDGAFLFLRRAGRRIRRLRPERHSSPAFRERALPRLSAKAQEAAEHPEAAHRQPAAGDGVQGREVAEKAQGLGREPPTRGEKTQHHLG